MPERKFNPGDKVVVTNVDGYTENGALVDGLFDIVGVGDKGMVVEYEDSPWSVVVEHDYGTFYYSESELERVE